MVTTVDLLRLATSFPYVNELAAIANASTDHISFLSYDESFITNVLGPNASQELVAQTSWAAFHEAGVYNKATGKLYATSNWVGDFKNPINVTAIDIHNGNKISSVRYENLAEANGGAAFYPVGTAPNSSDGQQIVFCDEGDLQKPSQLTLVDPATNTSRVLINNFLGRNFSSLNDVEQHPVTGDLWFTDARYGYWQYFRPEPVIRPQVYRFEPNTGVVQAVADDFIAPNGIEFSPDWKHIYVTDTGVHTYPGKDNLTGPASIYRFDITNDGKRLHNRQLFAYSDIGLPDGIHTDTHGNVYSGVGDGIHVWNPEGVLIGKIAVANGGVNNFAFVPGGLYVFNANKLFKVTFKAEGRTVKRDFGL
ncbi:lactonohydrolase [Acrodontium crateriforme]|uniref:Lactonohydrolase n=1 Tax=Acrodontium crateriforme TaxID=150365 RepID=A0AAQ3M4W3_9PEZI|nr:lactonohydrolase [Acrodontium crateriforme]